MAIDRFNRTKFIQKNLINGIKECDLPFNGFKDFNFKRPMIPYIIVQEDIQRPELLSYKLYQKINYWWIIMKVNNIEDIWNDLEIGQEILLPDTNDIEEFYRTTKK